MEKTESETVKDCLDRRLKKLTYDDVVDWMGERYAARAWNYRERVEGVYFVADGYTATVRGTDRYVTKMSADLYGEFTSVCTCPLGGDCKHAGALAFVVSERMAQGVAISSDVPKDILATLEEVEARHHQKTKKEPQQTKVVPDYVIRFKREFAEARQAVDDACKTKDLELIKDRLLQFLAFADDDEFYMSPEELVAESECITPTLDKAIERRRELGEGLVELLVWGYEVQMRYSLFGTWLGGVINHPSEEVSDLEIWRQVAERLEKSLLGMSSDWDGEMDMEYMMRSVREAWKRAGNEERALDSWLKMYARCGFWYETAELLNKFGRYDEAIAIARAGIRVGETTSEFGNDYSTRLQTPLAEALGGKGDWNKATAVLAEQFLDCVGAYDYNRSEESFAKVLEFAERAGCRDEVYRALIHALETGWNPKCLWTYTEDRMPRSSDWRSVPKRVRERSTDPLRKEPNWPFPKAEEGIRLFSFRWGVLEWFCQMDMEFLLRLAIVKGDREEVARRFEDLIHFPKEDSKVNVDKLREMMRGYRQDIVEAICMKTCVKSQTRMISAAGKK